MLRAKDEMIFIVLSLNSKIVIRTKPETSTNKDENKDTTQEKKEEKKE